MKIRNGFVSNSSSSSFIISNQYFPTVRSLATYMINRQIKETIDDKYDGDGNLSMEDANSWDVSYIKANKKYIERLKNIDENQNVSFPSCNYDTYIRRVADCYLVATCNNTNWDLWEYSTGLTEDAKEALRELSKRLNYDEADEIIDIIDGVKEFYHLGKDYYDLNKEIIGIEIYEECPNKKRNEEEHKYSYMWDTVKWGKICLVCNPYYKRKDKLNIINDIACKKD